MTNGTIPGYIPKHLQGKVDSFLNEPDGRISFRHDEAGQGGFGDSDGGGRKYITKDQYKLTFDPKHRLVNIGQASRDAYGLPRYPTNSATAFNDWVGGKLRKGLDWGLSTEGRTAGTSGVLAALAGGVGGTLLAQRAGEENPIKKGLLMALLAGTTGVGMSTFMQDRNNRRESMLAQKRAAVSDEAAYLRSVILSEAKLGASEKASVLKGLAKMDADEREELAERSRKLFGFGAGMYIARVLFSKGLIPPIVGGIIGAALLTPSNRPKLNPWGQPSK